jgi:outer membrane protein assembly factor BamE (lipoprotein component of BamABCDE complex)
MKKLFLLLLLAGLGAFAAGAASGPAPVSELRLAGITTPQTEDTVEPSQVPPRRGMSMAQVRKLYGEPDNQRGDPSGMTWYYFFNRAMYFIPFYYAKPRTAIFHFNEAGVLVDFHYTQ